LAIHLLSFCNTKCTYRLEQWKPRRGTNTSHVNALNVVEKSTAFNYLCQLPGRDIDRVNTKGKQVRYRMNYRPQGWNNPYNADVTPE